MSASQTVEVFLGAPGDGKVIGTVASDGDFRIETESGPVPTLGGDFVAVVSSLGREATLTVEID